MEHRVAQGNFISVVVFPNKKVGFVYLYESHPVFVYNRPRTSESLLVRQTPVVPTSVETTLVDTLLPEV